MSFGLGGVGAFAGTLCPPQDSGMSVELRNVSKKFNIGGVQHMLFDNLNMRIGPGDRIGVLGLPKTGKTTLLKMICGTEFVYEGEIERTSRVSWPIPLADFLVGFIPVATNIRFIERLYGQKNEDFAREVAEKGDITEYLNKDLAECPRHVKTQLAFALGLGSDFDVYLFDDRLISGGKDYKDKAARLIEELGPNRALLIATGNPKEVQTYCTSVFVLNEGRAVYHADVKEGVKYFKSLQRKEDEEFDNPRDSKDAGDEDMGIDIGL
jgi:capsular polysaccharide transport system ATP-binding protein